jgi:hypothetical protein
MRRFSLLALVVALLGPAAAMADRSANGDGSLVVSNAAAKLTVSGRGLIYGHIDRGTITVVGDYKPDDHGALPSVSGAKLRLVAGNVVYSGSDMRFIFPGGRYSLTLDGVGIDISAVGAGKFSAVGKGFSDDGTFTVDGNAPQPVDWAVAPVAYGGKSNGLGVVRAKSGD